MRPGRRFRVRLWGAFFAVLALIGLGTVVLTLTEWSALGALGVGLAVLLLVFLVARAVIAGLARPVELLTEATRRFGEGELGHRITIPPRILRWRERHSDRTGRGPHELLSLALAWNEMADRVERLVKGQRELLANVSHELRSPLARVRLALALVPRKPDNARRLDDVALDLDDLERLIDDTLTASRLEATGLPTQLGDVAVPSLFAALVERAASAPITAGLVVTTEISPSATRVVADAALLRRALWNLVENAAKYGAPPIKLVAVPTTDGSCLSVSDAGPGVPAELRPRLFDPFARAAEHRGAAGFGLGLTIARRVAEVHGGRLELAPTTAGARFDLILPA